MINSKIAALLDRLIEYGSQFSGARFASTDIPQHYRRYFYSKMLEQCTSYIMLYSKNKTDAILIARSIIEGFALLIYLRENPEKISKRWLNFSNIDAYRYLTDINSDNEKKIDDVLNNILKHITNNCKEFEVKKKGYLINGKKYCSTWYYPESITGIVRKLGNEMLLLSYNEYSNWHHWGPLSRILTIECEGNEYFIKEHESLSDSVFIVFFCLINSISEMINIYYEDTKAEELNNYKELMMIYRK
jgi:hypothetical protein